MSPIRVLVTGGGRGIGRAIALRFAREGARVVVAARTSTELDRVVEEIQAAGGQGLAAQMNVRDQGSVAAAVWRAVDFTQGALDVLVNNAGVFEIRPFAETDEELWKRTIEVNLNGPYFVTHEALEALEEGERPHVLNIASVAARRGFPGNVAYCASKYGLRGFGDALREDLRPLGIRVSTLYPGNVDTGIWDQIPGNWERDRMARPEEVAELVWRAWRAPEGAPVDDLDLESELPPA
jgi:NAD(P)-dependent dehydrogenase (short-subunit alcohol dehydrogenase family)